MNGLAFFDTNTLVDTGDKSSPEKQSRAIGLFTGSQQRGLAVISLQVLQEYFVTTRKLGVDPELAQQKVKILSRGRVVRFSESDDRARRSHRRSNGAVQRRPTAWNSHRRRSDHQPVPVVCPGIVPICVDRR